MGFDTAPQSLLSASELFGHSLFPISPNIPRKTHGVYFIIKDGEVVYLGRSINLSLRVKDSLRRVNCDTAFYIQLLPRDIYRNEKRYIRKQKWTVEDILNVMSETTSATADTS